MAGTFSTWYVSLVEFWNKLFLSSIAYYSLEPSEFSAPYALWKPFPSFNCLSKDYSIPWQGYVTSTCSCCSSCLFSPYLASICSQGTLIGPVEVPKSLYMGMMIFLTGQKQKSIDSATPMKCVKLCNLVPFAVPYGNPTISIPENMIRSLTTSLSFTEFLALTISCKLL